MTWGDDTGSGGDPFGRQQGGQQQGGQQQGGQQQGGYADNEALPGYGGYQPSGYGQDQYQQGGYQQGQYGQGQYQQEPYQQGGQYQQGQYQQGQYGQGYGGYGGGYQGLGTYGSPKGGGRQRLLIVGLVVVLVAAVATGAVILITRNGKPNAQQGGQTPPQSTTQGPPPSTGGSTTDSGGPASIAPKVAGWQVVPVRDHSIAYDVPPTWKVNSLGTVIGFEDQNGKPLVSLNTTAEFAPRFCPSHSGQSHGGSGLTTVPTGDAATAASTLAKKFAVLAWDPTEDSSKPPKVTEDAPIPVQVGKAHGFEVVAHATATATDECHQTGGTADVVVVSSSSSGGMGALVAWADSGIPNATSPQDLHQIVTSLRGTS